MKFLGHVIRKEKLEHLYLAGLIPGKRARGGQRQTYLEKFHKSPTTLIHDAYDRRAWKKVAHEAINGIRDTYPRRKSSHTTTKCVLKRRGILVGNSSHKRFALS